MKHVHLVLTVCGIMAFQALQSQTLLINFTGSGLSTNVTTVHCTNLDRDSTVTLLGADTLHLVQSIGMEENTKGIEEGSLRIFPNPVVGDYQFEFMNPAFQQVLIKIVDVEGKTLVREGLALQEGLQCFRAGGLKEGMYFLHVSTATNDLTGRVVVMGSNSGTPYISFSQGFSKGLPTGRIEGGKGKAILPYSPGERILFRGISGNYSRVLTLVATQSQAVDFNFVACTDGNGTHYPVVTIGTQTWMAKNLKATKYNNATVIPKVTEANAWTSFTTPAYCWYDNDSATYSEPYGALYKWYVVAAGNLCPTGWHVPLQSEWTTLKTFLGVDTLIGGLLKETGLLHWDSLNTGGSNATGFTAIPGGMRYIGNGNYQDKGHFGYFWAGNDYSASFAYSYSLAYNSTKITSGGNNKGNGFSVRCVKD